MRSKAKATETASMVNCINELALMALESHQKPTNTKQKTTLAVNNLDLYKWHPKDVRATKLQIEKNGTSSLGRYKQTFL